MNPFLSRNMHSIERIARVILGAILLSLAFIGPRTPFGYLGIIPLLTGLAGNCPLYSVFGFSTCSVKAR